MTGFFRWVLAAFLLVPLFSCGTPGKPEEAYGCDLWENGRCSLEYGDLRSYTARIPESRRKTWRDFAYYLYFHSRITPGIRVNFEAPLPPEKRSALKQELVCRYSLSKGDVSVTGELEGVRIDEDGDGFWCFDYLGTMLLHLVRESKMEEEAPFREFFPLHIELDYRSTILNARGIQSSDLLLDWGE